MNMGIAFFYWYRRRLFRSRCQSCTKLGTANCSILRSEIVWIDIWSANALSGPDWLEELFGSWRYYHRTQIHVNNDKSQSAGNFRTRRAELLVLVCDSVCPHQWSYETFVSFYSLSVKNIDTVYHSNRLLAAVWSHLLNPVFSFSAIPFYNLSYERVVAGLLTCWLCITVWSDDIPLSNLS